MNSIPSRKFELNAAALRGLKPGFIPGFPPFLWGQSTNYVQGKVQSERKKARANLLIGYLMGVYLKVLSKGLLNMGCYLPYDVSFKDNYWTYTYASLRIQAFTTNWDSRELDYVPI